MDPDKALKEIRELCKDLQKASEHNDMPLEVIDLITAIRGLDEWLKNGGYKPKDWK